MEQSASEVLLENPLSYSFLFFVLIEDSHASNLDLSRLKLGDEGTKNRHTEVVQWIGKTQS